MTRSAAAFGYPVYLDLHEVPVLVVGGGTVAARKAAGLLGAGAVVRVVAPVVGDTVRALVTAHSTSGPSDTRISVQLKQYDDADLDGIQLVIAATDDSTVNAAVATAARARRVLVNSADDPANCTFILPAIARRGRLSVAVSSGGASPALARHVRDRIADEVLTEPVAAAAEVLAAERAAIHERGASTEGLDWGRRITELLSSGPAVDAGRRSPPPG